MSRDGAAPAVRLLLAPAQGHLTSAFEGFLAVVFPLMFATATLLVYRVNGDPEAMQFAGLGAARHGHVDLPGRDRAARC